MPENPNGDIMVALGVGRPPGFPLVQLHADHPGRPGPEPLSPKGLICPTEPTDNYQCVVGTGLTCGQCVVGTGLTCGQCVMGTGLTCVAQSPSRYVEKQKPNGQQMLGAETEGLSGLLALMRMGCGLGGHSHHGGGCWATVLALDVVPPLIQTLSLQHREKNLELVQTQT
ncbi:unnamed protein product [Boreogadus saida]